jgi:predicted transposase YdaD
LRSQELKQKDLEIAQKMLAEGLDVKMISHITGLEISEIEKLKTKKI